jgi:hypothetical protein
MSNDSGAPTAFVILIFAVVFGYVLVVVLLQYVLYAIALSMFFRKVGVENWIAWVPFYRYWKWLEVGGYPGVYVLFGLIPYGNVVTFVFIYIGMWHTGKAFGKDAGMLVLGIFLPFVWLFILASKDEVYRPELITAAGYPPPLAGYGSAAYAAEHPAG